MTGEINRVTLSAPVPKACLPGVCPSKLPATPPSLSVRASPRRRKKKGNKSSKTSNIFRRFLRDPAVKTLVILSILVSLSVSLPSQRASPNTISGALECPMSDSTPEKSQTSVTMSVNPPPPSGDSEIKVGLSAEAPQNVPIRDAEIPSQQKLSWRRLEREHKSIVQLPSPKKGPDE